ncbi:unnamed protein product [Phytophthora fragariaefolia]|uniref:Unnamed protein product n=1 Tax=Phytophthora fragariaefolia TaxID=1490495 RepID=A0A9W7D6X2_9STRA|nr:unnamed protein product [Phytophthora fragariaefolia]
MQRYCVVLLVFALLTITDVDSATPASISPADNLPESIRSIDISDRRLLRTYKTENAIKEERAITIPGLSKIKEWVTLHVSWFKTWYNNGKQANIWMNEKKTPDEVFKILKLDEDINTVLNNPKLTTWVAFMRIYNKNNKGKTVTLIGMLTKHYGNLPLTKMIETARRNPATRRLANRLQTDQLVGWAGNGLSTDVVYMTLKVGDGTVDKLLANPALNVWFYYFNRMNNHDPDREVNLIKKLRSSYDDMELAKAIEVATKEKTTEFIAKELQTAQFKLWKADGRDPRTVFNMLMLDTKKWPYDPNVDVYRAYYLFYKANK